MRISIDPNTRCNNDQTFAGRGDLFGDVDDLSVGDPVIAMWAETDIIFDATVARITDRLIYLSARHSPNKIITGGQSGWTHSFPASTHQNHQNLLDRSPVQQSLHRMPIQRKLLRMRFKSWPILHRAAGITNSISQH